MKTADLPTRIVIVDDSAVPGVFEQLVLEYGAVADVICFPENRSQWWAMDFMVSYCSTPYVFYLEDDWEFTQGGYLGLSKTILERYRDVGLVDISFRTFADEGYETFHPKLVDETFFVKKPWRLSPNHLFWCGWVGSPNLKRRDDLLLLGRVEKWHNEWNIDRRFAALGFKYTYLNGSYCVHIGWHNSAMDGKRPSDQSTPEAHFPQELRPNRLFPEFDYYHLEKKSVVQ